jgi:hypothetical protein
LLDGYVGAESGTAENNRWAKDCTLSAAGGSQLAVEREEFKRIVEAIQTVLGRVTVSVRRFLRRLTIWVRLRSHEAELSDELAFHREMIERDLRARGWSPEDAKHGARRAMGNETYMREEARAVVIQPWLEAVWQDAKYALRGLARNPGRRSYAALSVVTLALGVGGTAAVYGLARALLFDPLPYAHESEVGVFWKKTDWTEEEFLYLRGRFPGFREVALYRFHDVVVREGDAPARLRPGLAASAELFGVLGAHPMLGRGFRAGDDATGAEPVAVLSFDLAGDGRRPVRRRHAPNARRQATHSCWRDAARLLVPQPFGACLDIGATQPRVAEPELHARRPSRTGTRCARDGAAGRAARGDARRAIRLRRAVG